MIDEDDAETLAIHVALIEQRTAEVAEAVKGRDEQIRGMLAKGAKPTELGRLAGMSRERIYQIKDGRR
ncbi:hypothetical protein [Leifsonia sp. Root4]|uniref:hypothetical protein n=1 Tax=Leifsonia sp. Root4 TaxID=1736525 RepID=UPI000A60C08E|nr:hypothetical protein [Leifsonia sp. Root4]